MHLIKGYWLVAIGILVGVAGGYLYWQQIGCVSGTCPITSSPVNSSLYGGMMGGLLFSMFKKNKN
ncbi:MAG: hypothetical protein JJE09_13535 [Bacteroidia bacterium]|nr:hypothetical protein [Bacteroidia bacterium]